MNFVKEVNRINEDIEIMEKTLEVLNKLKKTLKRGKTSCTALISVEREDLEDILNDILDNHGFRLERIGVRTYIFSSRTDDYEFRIVPK